MDTEYRNIYQIARESAGITQERAAELLSLSVESLRAYEYGRRLPQPDTVLQMIGVYACPSLAYQHLRHSSELGRTCIPSIKPTDLPSAILTLQKEVADFLKLQNEMIEITYDGVISEDERPRWNVIMKELEDIVAAIMTLQCVCRSA